MDALRLPSGVEVPLALEFEADLGTVQIFDRSVASGVEIGGAAFDVYVPEAFVRSESNCVDCNATEVTVLVLRDPRL